MQISKCGRTNNISNNTTGNTTTTTTTTTNDDNNNTNYNKTCLLCLYVYMHVYIHIHGCVYIYIYIYTHTPVFIHTFSYVHIYVYMHKWAISMGKDITGNNIQKVVSIMLLNVLTYLDGSFADGCVLQGGLTRISITYVSEINLNQRKHLTWEQATTLTIITIIINVIVTNITLLLISLLFHGCTNLPEAIPTRTL